MKCPRAKSFEESRASERANSRAKRWRDEAPTAGSFIRALAWCGAVCVGFAAAPETVLAQSGTAPTKAPATAPSTATTTAPSTRETQDTKPAGDAPAAAPAATPRPAGEPPAVPAKSLDDLLGVPSDGGDRSAEDAAEREQAERLQRSLDESSLQDLVTRALDGMKNASGRLSDQRDAGIGTQRIQADVVLTLDRLLEEAQRQQQKSKSSSSSSSRSQKQQKSDPSEQRQQQSQQRQRAQQQQSQQPGDNQSGEAEPPPMEEGTADGGELSESRIEWGRLPERVRDLVLQGRRDKVSSLYERLTREYYRRLAEEASK